MRWIVRLTLCAFVAALSISARIEAVALAETAVASRSFDYAVLHRSDPGTARLIVRTATGSDKPRRVLLRAEGERALASAEGSGRWVLRRTTVDDRALIAAMRRELDEAAFVKLRAAGRYGGGARCKVLFKIRDFNQRDNHPQVEEGCV
jgi:hypothetical protein